MTAKKSVYWGVLLGCLTASNYALSEKISIDGSLGNATLSESGYTSGMAIDASVAFAHSNFLYRAGGLHIEEISLEDNKDDSDITISGAYLGIGHRIDLKIIQLELEGGAAFTQTEATYQDREIANEKDTNPYVNIRFVKKLSNLISLQGGWKHINDVNGTDLNLIQAGMRFSF